MHVQVLKLRAGLRGRRLRARAPLRRPHSTLCLCGRGRCRWRCRRAVRAAAHGAGARPGLREPSRGLVGQRQGRALRHGECRVRAGPGRGRLAGEQSVSGGSDERGGESGGVCADGYGRAEGEECALDGVVVGVAGAVWWVCEGWGGRVGWRRWRGVLYYYAERGGAEGCAVEFVVEGGVAGSGDGHLGGGELCRG